MTSRSSAAAQLIRLLTARGYTLQSSESLAVCGLPCLLAPSKTRMIAVGRWRCIGFTADARGRMVADQVSETSALILRAVSHVEVITAAAALPIPWQADPLSDDFDSLLAFTKGVTAP